MMCKRIFAIGLCITAFCGGSNRIYGAPIPVQSYSFSSDYSDMQNFHDMYGVGGTAIDNGALVLDGSGYLETANITGSAPNGISHNNFSVSGFFKLTSNSQATIFSMGYTRFPYPTWPDTTFRVLVQNNGSIIMQSRANTNWQTQTTSAAGLIAVGETYHFAAVYDGTNNQNRIYLNGDLVASIIHVYNQPLFSYPAATDQRMYIGVMNEGVQQDVYLDYFNGYIDEFNVYQDALTTQDVIDEYTAGNHQIPSPIAAIPEPCSVVLLGVAIAALGKRIRKE